MKQETIPAGEPAEDVLCRNVRHLRHHSQPLNLELTFEPGAQGTPEPVSGEITEGHHRLHPLSGRPAEPLRPCGAGVMPVRALASMGPTERIDHHISRPTPIRVKRSSI